MNLYNKEQEPREILVKVLKLWLPYCVIFLGAGIWRAFFFKYQTKFYQFDALNLLGVNPWLEIKQILWSILRDIELTVIGCWKNVFSFPSLDKFGIQSTLLYSFVIVGLAILLGFILLSKYSRATDVKDNPVKHAILLIELGLFALLLGGIPFWTTGLEVTDYFPNDRFSLPFVLGSSFIFVGILFLLLRNSSVRSVVFVSLIALAGGLQVRYEIGFQRDWKTLQRFIEQMTWRIPSLDPGTIIYSQDLP